MSRIGKLPIKIPSGVTITTTPDGLIEVKGGKGTLNIIPQKGIKVKVEGDEAVVTRESEEFKAGHGLQRSLLANAVKGVSEGFSKQLEVNGVGFRLSSKGPREIEMALGFSHPVKYVAQEGVELKVEKMIITVSGIDKQKVGQTAAEIRKLKKPEPYKGKGIKYVDEVILRKAGKTGVK